MPSLEVQEPEIGSSYIRMDAMLSHPQPQPQPRRSDTPNPGASRPVTRLQDELSSDNSHRCLHYLLFVPDTGREHGRVRLEVPPAAWVST
jgi:hypothetical protein